MDASLEALDASAQPVQNTEADLEALLHRGCKLDSLLFRRVKTVANSELRANPKETLALLTAWALSTSLLLRSRKPSHRKLAVTLSRRLWRKDKELWTVLFQEFQSARLSGKLLPVLSIGCSFGDSPSESAEFDKLKVLKRIFDITLAVKKPSEPANLECCSHLLNCCIDENTFVSELIPASHRSFLRTPETAVSGLSQFDVLLFTGHVEYKERKMTVKFKNGSGYDLLIKPSSDRDACAPVMTYIDYKNAFKLKYR
ncbi:unnamed protein product, partial [Dibothriocephalus latus]